MTTARKAMFERTLTDYDERSLKVAVEFDRHRFVSIERDPVTDERYVRGHRNLRGACDHLAGAIESDGLVAEHVLDLDSGELHALDIFTSVAPKDMNAVAVMMPRSLAVIARDILRGVLRAPAAEQAANLLTAALERNR